MIFDIEHIKGVDNIVADMFSRLVEEPPTIEVNTVVVAQCTPTQTAKIREAHEFESAHWGVERTYARVHKLFPGECSKWPSLYRDVRDYVRRCPTCQVMSATKALIKAQPFVLSNMEPMSRIGMDTIGPLPKSTSGFKYIIVIIDHFSRYIELFAAPDVSAQSAARALHRHVARFGAPVELITDQRTQYVNAMFEEFMRMAKVTRIDTAPYSKEENGIVEHANKEVNRHLRYIMFDTGVKNQWAQCLPMVESLFNSTAKLPTGVAPNTIIFGRWQLPEEGLIGDFLTKPQGPVVVRKFLDNLFKR